jgi:adenylate cyclase
MEPAKQARVERRLAAILAADVAGYSRLIGADEEGTVRRLKSMRAGLIDPTISEHKGRIVHTAGDGLLVEFHSVVDAMRDRVAGRDGPTQRRRPAGCPHRLAYRGRSRRHHHRR